ncbi:MAG: ComEC/Rec2 family competence protein, partial [Pseudomonadota bacterium]
MRFAVLSFVVGVSLLQASAELPSLAFLCVALGACLCLALAGRGLWRAIPCALICGFAWAALLAHFALAPELAKGDEGRDVTLVGTIDSLPFVFDDGVRFNFAVEQVKGAPFKMPPRVSLAWYAGFRNARQEVGAVQPGERWQLTVRLQRPHGNANPYGFDYEVYLLEQGVRATGYVRPDDGANRRLDSFVFSFGNVVERCRAALRERILRALAGKQYAGVIVALVVGDQRGIEQSDWRIFNRTGIGHLISISGLHITMVAGLCAWCASALWRRSRSLPLRLPAQKVAALAGAATALLYVLLAGFGVPAQRTLYMLCVVAVALWYGRLTSVSHVLCAALGVVVLLDPWAVLWPGFWLSFGAVATILFASVGRVGVPKGYWRAALHTGVRTQYAVTVGLVPLTMLLFAQVSLVSPLANAIAIPLVSFVVTPLALVGSVLPTSVPLQFAHLCIEGLAWLLTQMAALPMATWNAPTPGAWVFALALAGTLWMLAPRGWPLRWIGVVSWLPLLA